VTAESVIALGADGRPDECLPGVGAGLAAWAAGRGFRVHAGALVASPVVLDTAAAKAALGATGALAVEMESGALAAAARARGVPFAALRAVLDAAGEALPAGADVIDEASGEVRAARALAAIALRPRLWPAAGRLLRQQRVAARRLAGIMGALEVAAISAPPEAATAAGG